MGHYLHHGLDCLPVCGDKVAERVVFPGVVCGAGLHPRSGYCLHAKPVYRFHLTVVMENPPI